MNMESHVEYKPSMGCNTYPVLYELDHVHAVMQKQICFLVLS